MTWTGRIDPPVPGWVRINSEWVAIQVVACISSHGGIRNRVVDGQGNERVVRNSEIRFRRPRRVL